MNGYFENFFNEIGIKPHFLNMFHIGIAIYNIDGIIIFANDKFKSMYGFDDIEIVGMNVKDFFLTGKAGIMEVLETGEPSSLRSISKNGHYGLTYRWPLKDATGKIIGAVSENSTVSLDVKKIDAMESFLEEIDKSDLVQNITRLGEDIAKDNFAVICGTSPCMLKLKKKAAQFAASDHQVLIMGENGTGKDLLAQAIHAASNRCHNNFVTVNCAAIPGELLESELFGYEKGAFTGARGNGKRGQFELAAGGTIFLDEIGEMPYPLQAKLLRVLENHEIQKLGSQQRICVDFRLLSATNCDLEDLVHKGKFRADLYYRLNLFDLVIPPLRERLEDIPELARYLLKSFNDPAKSASTRISQDVLDAFQLYPWRGNVRELRNILTYAVYSMNPAEKEIRLEHLPDRFFRHDQLYPGTNLSTSQRLHLPETAGVSPDGLAAATSTAREDIHQIVLAAEKKAIVAALTQAGGNKAKTARALGISRSNLYKKLALYDLK